jgi:hypothetical protein
MRIVAHKRDGRTFLLDVGDGQGQVLSLDEGRVRFPPMPLAARDDGPWEAYTGSQELLLVLFARLLPAWARRVTSKGCLRQLRADEVEAEASGDQKRLAEIRAEKARIEARLKRGRRLVIIGDMQDDRTFLLDAGDELGVVIDLDKEWIYRPAPMSFFSSQFGPWYEHTGPQERLLELLAQVKPAPPPLRPGRTAEEDDARIKELEEALAAEEKSRG